MEIFRPTVLHWLRRKGGQHGERAIFVSPGDELQKQPAMSQLFCDRQKLITFLLCAFALTTVSCANRGFAVLKHDTAIVGPSHLIESETFQKIDLARELYPAGPSLEEPNLYERYLGLDNATLKKNREILTNATSKF